jgi:hypothetical protein
MESSRDAVWKRRGLHDRALLRLFEGRTREAVELLDEAIRAYDERGRSKQSSINSYTAHILLEKGNMDRERVEEVKKKLQLSS